jgi:serine/threonine protein kinase
MRIIANIAYEQGDLIGKGQNSLGVYLCQDEQLGGQFAVKVIEKAKIQDPAKLWAEANAMYEAKHPHVVPVQYGCNTDDKIMLAMPYFQRGSLTDRIGTSPLRLLEVIRVAQGMLSGLYQIHAKSYLHNDLKPSNVLYSDNDVVMVSDFGQAQKLGTVGTAPAPDLIYAAAVAPEVLLTQQGTVASDVYQAGLTVYRALNSDPHFDDQYFAAGAELEAMTLEGTFPDRESYLPHVPKAFRMTVNRALQIDLNKRYATAVAFAAALGRLVVKHDWQPICSPNGEIEWRSKRFGCPDLVVRKVKSGPRWDVTLHHERPGKTLRTKKILWRSGLTDHQAISHLRQVFGALE